MATQQHTKDAANKILAIMEEWRAAEKAANPEYMEDGVVVDFILGFTVQRFTDEDELTWENSFIAMYGQGPNTHAGLSAWVADNMSVSFMEDQYRDE